MCDKTFDPVTFDITKVKAEDFASQLTILDAKVFAVIQPEVTFHFSQSS